MVVCLYCMAFPGRENWLPSSWNTLPSPRTKAILPLSIQTFSFHIWQQRRVRVWPWCVVLRLKQAMSSDSWRVLANVSSILLPQLLCSAGSHSVCIQAVPNNGSRWKGLWEAHCPSQSSQGDPSLFLAGDMLCTSPFTSFQPGLWHLKAEINSSRAKPGSGLLLALSEVFLSLLGRISASTPQPLFL